MVGRSQLLQDIRGYIGRVTHQGITGYIEAQGGLLNRSHRWHVR
jgi:hypothetical protein